jgi:hypothetical protein
MPSVPVSKLDLWLQCSINNQQSLVIELSLIKTSTLWR